MFDYTELRFVDTIYVCY